MRRRLSSESIRLRMCKKLHLDAKRNPRVCSPGGSLAALYRFLPSSANRRGLNIRNRCEKSRFTLETSMV